MAKDWYKALSWRLIAMSITAIIALLVTGNYELAAGIAFKQAAKKASPVLMEPIMSVEVTTPDEFTGGVTGDLTGNVTGNVTAVSYTHLTLPTKA